MRQLVKPKALKPGDRVATISLSWGGAGQFPDRYQQGKRQLQTTFGVEVVETRHALQSAQWLYEHPQARAQDLMQAFADPTIKAIISTIGGEDSNRILRYVDVGIIQQNPKIFLGFSDSTITHLLCLKAGLSSFYGTSLLVGFAENGGMHSYQIADIQRTLFSPDRLAKSNPTKAAGHRSCWIGQTPPGRIPPQANTKHGLAFPSGEEKRTGTIDGGMYGDIRVIKRNVALAPLRSVAWLHSIFGNLGDYAQAGLCPLVVAQLCPAGYLTKHTGHSVWAAFR